MHCLLCNTSSGRLIRTKVGQTPAHLCTRCYYSYQRSDGLYEIPEAGTIEYSMKGWPICHICGLAHRKVLQHAYYAHDITAYDYKVKFKLTKHRGVLSADSRAIARQRVYEHKEICIDQNLIQKGQNTRYQKEETQC